MTNLHILTAKQKVVIPEVITYLEAQGFNQTRTNATTICMYNGTTYIFIKPDHVDIMEMNDGELGQKSRKLDLLSSHTGIEDFELIDWMMLLHITKVIKLGSFFRLCAKEFNTTEEKFMEELLRHFRINDNPHTSIPNNY